MFDHQGQSSIPSEAYRQEYIEDDLGGTSKDERELTNNTIEDHLDFKKEIKNQYDELEDHNITTNIQTKPLDE